VDFIRNLSGDKLERKCEKEKNEGPHQQDSNAFSFKEKKRSPKASQRVDDLRVR